MKKVCEAKLKQLREQEKYSRNDKHIAPEIVNGTHPPTIEGAGEVQP